MELERFIDILERLTAEDLCRVAAGIEAASASAAGEIAWWHATVGIDRMVRRRHCGRQATVAAHRAARAVLAAAAGRIEVPSDRVTLVARAAGVVARGLVAGDREHVDQLLREWSGLGAVTA